MEETKLPKIKVSTHFINVYEKIAATLKNRNYNLSHSEFIDELIELVSPEKIEEFIETKTPLEFKIKEALSDPQKREALEKLVSNKKRTNQTKLNENQI